MYVCVCVCVCVYFHSSSVMQLSFNLILLGFNVHIQSKLLQHTSVMGTHSSYQLLVVTLLEVSEREEGVMALHLPIEPLKPALGLSRYRDANPGPSSPLADDTVSCRVE